MQTLRAAKQNSPHFGILPAVSKYAVRLNARSHHRVLNELRDQLLKLLVGGVWRSRSHAWHCRMIHRLRGTRTWCA